MGWWLNDAVNLHPNHFYVILRTPPMPHDKLHAHQTHPKYSTQVELYLPHPCVSTDVPSSKSAQHPYLGLQHQRFPRRTGGTDGNDPFAAFHNGTSARYTRHEASHREASYAPAWHVHSLLFLQDAKSKTQADYLCPRRCTFLFQRYPLHHQLSV